MCERRRNNDDLSSMGHMDTSNQMKIISDVMFLVGRCKTPIHGNRAVISNSKLGALLQEADESSVNMVSSGGSTTADQTNISHKQEQPLVISLPTYNEESFRLLLSFVYNQSIWLTDVVDDDLLDLIILCNIYDFPEVKTQCIDVMRSRLKPEQAVKYFHYGVEGNLKIVRDEALEIIRRDPNKACASRDFLNLSVISLGELVKDDYVDVDETCLLLRVIDWANGQCHRMVLPSVKEVICPILPHIRFPLIPLAKYFEVNHTNQLMSLRSHIQLLTFYDNAENMGIVKAAEITEGFKYSVDKRKTWTGVVDPPYEVEEIGSSNDSLIEVSSGSFEEVEENQSIILISSGSVSPTSQNLFEEEETCPNDLRGRQRNQCGIIPEVIDLTKNEERLDAATRIQRGVAPTRGSPARNLTAMVLRRKQLPSHRLKISKAHLLYLVLKNSKRTLVCSEITSTFEKFFPHYSNNGRQLKPSILYVLKTNDCFVRVRRSKEKFISHRGRGKAFSWKLTTEISLKADMESQMNRIFCESRHELENLVDDPATINLIRNGRM